MQVNRGYYFNSSLLSLECINTEDDNPIRAINRRILAAPVLPADRLYNPQIPNTATAKYLR
jgi:hypothetical protein